MTNFEPGTEVYWTDDYGTTRGGFIDRTHEGYVEILTTYPCKTGAFTVEKTKCYGTLEQCVDADNKAAEDKINKYLQEIQTVEDLARFCFNHTVNYAEEYTDYKAREAASRAAKRLGIPGFED